MREHLVYDFVDKRVALFVHGVEMVNFTALIYDEDFSKIYPHSSIRNGVSVPVSKARIEAVLILRKQIFDIPERSYFEQLEE